MKCFIKGTHNDPISIDNNSAHGLISQTQKGERLCAYRDGHSCCYDSSMYDNSNKLIRMRLCDLKRTSFYPNHNSLNGRSTRNFTSLLALKRLRQNRIVFHDFFTIKTAIPITKLDFSKISLLLRPYTKHSSQSYSQLVCPLKSIHIDRTERHEFHTLYNSFGLESSAWMQFMISMCIFHWERNTLDSCGILSVPHQQEVCKSLGRGNTLTIYGMQVVTLLALSGNFIQNL